MSIRALALELYRAQQRVDQLQKRHDAAAQVEKAELGRELKFAQKELEMLRKMMDGRKEAGQARKRYGGFGNFKR